MILKVTGESHFFNETLTISLGREAFIPDSDFGAIYQSKSDGERPSLVGKISFEDIMALP